METTPGRPVIAYRTGNDLDVDAVIDCYAACSLGARRPIDDRPRMVAMIAGSNLVLTAWDHQLLVGISRALSDFAYVTYLADLAVRESHQRQGIGKELIRRTQTAAPRCQLVLLAAPAAREYYPKIGMTQHHSAWWLKPGQSISE